MTQEEFNAMLAVGISQGLPGSYYTSRYKNGEEIDRRLGNAAVPAVGDNILINADFRNPVNRNGKTVYTSRRFCIDNWFAESPVTIESDCISISASIGGGIIQALERVPNGPLTFSIIVKEGKGVLFAENNQAVYFSGAGLYFITYQNGINPITDKIYIRAHDYSTLKLVAAKLESGSTQTLAKQNSDGKWEPIAPPNYPLQYALCSQYSPSTGEWVGSQHSNPNLLDNWYFLDPINQRGQTEYTNSGYIIDRWYFGGSSQNIKYNVSENTLSCTYNKDRYSVISQFIETPANLSGVKLTLSCLFEEMKKVIIQIWKIDSSNKTVSLASSGSWENDKSLLSISLTVPSNILNTDKIEIIIQTQEKIKIVAAKLELGAQQTLAHQDPDGKWILNDAPPNKALELAKCQRYQYLMPGIYSSEGMVDGSMIRIGINPPCTMRAAPTVANTLNTQMALSGINGEGYYENLSVSFTFSSPASCIVQFANPDPSKFPSGTPVVARIDTAILLDANL